MNAIAVLEPRQAPLAPEDFDKIETLIGQCFDVKTKTERRTVPRVDTAGETYGWEYDLVETGMSLIPKAQVNQRLIESIQRPATAKIIAYHLTRLSAHKRNTRGGFGFQVIVEDACRDLEGCSEWALCKAYDKLRNEGGAFFPDLPDIVKAVKWFDDAAKNINTPAEPVKREPQPYRREQAPARTPEMKATVEKLVHDNLHKSQPSPATCSLCRGETP